MNRAEFNVATLCRVLDVSPSGYDAWRRRSPSPRQCSDAALTERIRGIHQASHRTYGAPRIHEALRAQGGSVARQRVARLMRRAGLQGTSRRQGATTTQSDKGVRPEPDWVE